jgi:DNA replication protein DnaC
MARIPEKFRDASLENFRTQGTHQDCRKLKAEVLEALHDGHSLVLASKTKGNGKTHLAVAFARERLKAGMSVMFWTVKDLLDAAKKSFDGKGAGDPLDEAQSVDVLVLDDLGMQFTRDWGYSELAGLINYRYNHQLQTLVTTNFAHPQDLADSMGEQGERIVSRLKEMAYWIVSQAPDYRSRGRQKRLGT